MLKNKCSYMNYKSKVNKFILQIDVKVEDTYERFRFEQIGANSYGILFKITGNKIPKSAIKGTYYILNEDFELITTGNYNCVR